MCRCRHSITHDADGYGWTILVDGEEHAADVEHASREDAEISLADWLAEHHPSEPDPQCQVCDGSGVAARATRWEPAERCGCDERCTVCGEGVPGE